MLIDASEIDPVTRLDLYEIPKRMMDAVTRRDADQYAACFTEDGVWDPTPLFYVSHGQETIRAAFNEAWDGLHWAFQGHYHTVIAAYSVERARMRTYLLELGQAKDAPGPSPVGVGLYTDDLVRIDGKWKIERHALTPVYFGSSDYSKPVFQKTPK